MPLAICASSTRSSAPAERSAGAVDRLSSQGPARSSRTLSKGIIAIPGKLTTAYLLLRLFDPSIENVTIMTFDRIMDAVSTGKEIAGLIIHESRFTYPLYKLEKLLDLGEWWERYSGLPIPLGGILGKRSLGRDDAALRGRRHP